MSQVPLGNACQWREPFEREGAEPVKGGVTRCTRLRPKARDKGWGQEGKYKTNV